MTDTFSGQPQGDENAKSLISKAEVSRIASQLSPDAIIPTSKEDSQQFRERLVRAFAQLTVRLGEYLQTCDSIVIDQTSGNYVGTYFEELAGLVRAKGFIVHNVVGSKRLQNRTANLHGYFREAFEHKKIGNKIVIVSEQAGSGEACQAIANAIQSIAAEFSQTPDICVASVSVDPRKFFFARSTGSRVGKWVWGEEGIIGTTAFRRPNLAEYGYRTDSAAPRQLDDPLTGEHVLLAHADMAMLARELAPLVLSKKPQ